MGPSQKFILKVLVAWVIPQLVIGFLFKNPFPEWTIPVTLAVSFLVYVGVLHMMFMPEEPNTEKKSS